ncbi:hypothetical protein ACGF07_27600 [Kitasatospora sp. NPDC048194]|uniref:hypothetical protein n=1 Tax=Kitasatospora sp. NPDC048194 TaxID=3364045 RepID=UPI00371126BF
MPFQPFHRVRPFQPVHPPVQTAKPVHPVRTVQSARPFRRSSPVRPRFWLETALGSLSGLLFLLTLVWPEWIETLLGLDPDAGSGAAEWLVVALLATATAACALAARTEWRRTHPSSARVVR